MFKKRKTACYDLFVSLLKRNLVGTSLDKKKETLTKYGEYSPL